MALPTLDPGAPAFMRTGINLADPRLGAETVLTNDDFFAPMARMLDFNPAVFIAGNYDDNGKWMDGWESRRKRVAGYDFCIVKLGVAGELMGVDIDTSHFTGNFPPAASIDACVATTTFCPPMRHGLKRPATALKGNAHHYRAIDAATRDMYTHVRLNIYPDGGVARLRVYGRPRRDLSPGVELDLASAMNGARIVAANNQHYGSASNLLLPTHAANMGEGWKTRRRREPGCDWCIIELATPGEINQISVDTAHFKGNFADRCSLRGRNGRVPDYAMDVLAGVARRAKARDGQKSYLCVDPKHARYTCALQCIAGWWRFAAEADGSVLDLTQSKPSPLLIRNLLETTHDACLAIEWPLSSKAVFGAIPI